ncbi:hypothetical protein pb186bvf_009087 [Paramecium bursaria]
MSESQEVQDYYKESVKLYYYNCILYNHLEKVLNDRNELKSRLQKFSILDSDLAQQDDEDILKELEERKRRCRRNGIEIDRKYSCTIQNCKKSYGTEASLIQHMKLKHKTSMDQFLSFDYI